MMIQNAAFVYILHDICRIVDTPTTTLVSALISGRFPSRHVTLSSTASKWMQATGQIETPIRIPVKFLNNGWRCQTWSHLEVAQELTPDP